MPRMWTLSLLLLLGCGCLEAGAGYYGGLPSSSAQRKIETATGSDLGDGAGVHLEANLDWPVGLPLYLSNDANRTLMVAPELAADFISKDRYQLSGTVSTRYIHGFGDTTIYAYGGVGLGWYQISIDGMSNEDAPGGYALLGVECTLGDGAVYLQVRHQVAEYDTSFGDLDSSETSIVVGFRHSLLTYLMGQGP